MLLDAIKTSAIDGRDAGEPSPNETTIQSAMKLIAEIPFPLVGRPDVSPFYGEIHVSWNVGTKQVVLICFPDRTPLVHHYQSMHGAASQHDIEYASPDRIAHWLRWLRA